jgi:hypothetical protein
MQPRRDDEARRSDEEFVHRPLPMQLHQGLGPKARRALMHGVRRQILRMVNHDQTPRTTRDLAPAFPGATLQAVTYHVLVLEECESLRVCSVEQAHGTLIRSFVSNVADDAQIAAVLQATEQMDGGR